MHAKLQSIPALSLAFLAAAEASPPSAGVAELEKLLCPVLSGSLLLLLLAEPLLLDRATVFTTSLLDLFRGALSSGTDTLPPLSCDH